MSPDKLQEILAGHSKWLRCEGGARAVLRGVDLRGADLRGVDLRGVDLTGADLTGAGLRGGVYLARAAVQFSGHGECGRELVAIKTDAKKDSVTLWCGCFMGTPEELEEYIAEGIEQYRKSRRLAMDTVLMLLNHEEGTK